MLFTTDYFVFVLTTSWEKCTENIDWQSSHKIYDYSSSVVFILLQRHSDSPKIKWVSDEKQILFILSNQEINLHCNTWNILIKPSNIIDMIISVH